MGLEMKKKSSKGTIDNLNFKMEGMQMEITNLTTECNEYKAKSEGFETNLGELNEQITNLRSNLNEKVVESAKLIQQNESLQDQIANFKSEIERINAQKKEVENERTLVQNAMEK